MLKHLYLIFIVTFLFGAVTGVIVFLLAHTGGEDSTVKEDKIDSLLITVFTYGGCVPRESCQSYRIQENGSYTFIPRLGKENLERRNGTLTQADMKKVRDQLAGVDYDAIRETSPTEVCPPPFEGVGYRYDIEYDGVKHVLNSCTHALGQVTLFETLNNFFKTFSDLHINDQQRESTL